MHSADDDETEGEEQNRGRAELPVAKEEVAPPLSLRSSSSETVDQSTMQNLNARPEEGRKSRNDEERSEEPRSASDSLLSMWDEDEPPSEPSPEQRHQRQTTAPDAGDPLSMEGTEEAPSLVPHPSSAPNSDTQRQGAHAFMPWWAGAFGAVPDMRDSPEARGFYARRFCEIFFSDNVAGATEASLYGVKKDCIGVSRSVHPKRPTKGGYKTTAFSRRQRQG